MTDQLTSKAEQSIDIANFDEIVKDLKATPKTMTQTTKVLFRGLNSPSWRRLPASVPHTLRELIDTDQAPE